MSSAFQKVLNQSLKRSDKNGVADSSKRVLEIPTCTSQQTPARISGYLTGVIGLVLDALLVIDLWS